MKRVKVRDCLSQDFIKVLEDASPSTYPGSVNFVVFNNASKTAIFRGLITRNEITEPTNSSFDTLLNKQKLHSTLADTDANTALTHMDKLGIAILPVLDKKNLFLGLVTKTSLLLALYQREHSLLLKAKKSNLIQKKTLKELSTQAFRLNKNNDYRRYAHFLLTDVNRSLIEEKIQEISGKEPSYLVAILVIDIDHFRDISDQISNFFAKLLLRQITIKIKSMLEPLSKLAHKPGDGFIIVLSHVAHPYEATKKAQSILDALKHPFIINSKNIYLTASIGISLYPQDTRKPEALLSYADMALTQAKKMGGNRIEFFTTNLYTQVHSLETRERLLYTALENNELVAHYQPLVDIQNNHIIGMEALMRWKNPELGFLHPKDFIFLAEKTDLIVPMDNWMLLTACQQVKFWQTLNKSLRITVNLSGLHFKANYQHNTSQLIKSIKSVLKETNLSPELLELELTETVLVENYNDEALIMMKKIKDLGVHLSCDDFGTGYSSLNYLKQFPIDTLKIDMSFIANIVDSPVDLAIVSAIINMAKTLSIQVIAEGVDEKEQLILLKELGCDIIQGYGFSKALPPDEMELLIKNNLEYSQYPLDFS